jgi:hypothetical protein
LFNNNVTKLTPDDLVEISLTVDGTYIFEGQSECIELTIDELMALHKALGLEIVRIKSYLDID